MHERQAAEQFAEIIRQTWGDMVVKERRPPMPHKHVYAGGWRACDRRLVYDMIAPHEAQPWSRDTLANFNRGKDRGRELVIDLQRVGRHADPQFDVFGQEERFELKGHGGQTVIVGKTDASLRIELPEFGRITARAEVKSWHPNLTMRIRTFRDLFDNTFTRAGAYQLLCYLYGSNEAIGLMVLDRPGLPLILPVTLYDHLHEVESFLGRAEAAVLHATEGTMPDYHDDPAECKRCSFFGWCNPPIKYAGAKVITDDEMLQMIAEHHELDPARKRYEAIHKFLSEQFKLGQVEKAVAGEYMVTGKFTANTWYALPDEIKPRYKRSNPKGKYTMTITKITGSTEPEDAL
jgi:hypothetical protein